MGSNRMTPFSVPKKFKLLEQVQVYGIDGSLVFKKATITSIKWCQFDNYPGWGYLLTGNFTYDRYVSEVALKKIYVPSEYSFDDIIDKINTGTLPAEE